MTSSDNIETEYLGLNKRNEWPVFYQKIRSESSKDSCSEALKPQNTYLNRYRDVSPFDHSRIVLQRGSTDYINANLIRVQLARRSYILTQGPLDTSISHFWLMVWEQQSRAILMLNKLIEKKRQKCAQYWPAKIGAEHLMTLADVGLSVEYLTRQDHSYYLTREFKLTDVETGDSRTILQFHYITWPDFGVPSSPNAFLEFLRKVREAGVVQESCGPAVVHCSAGIGRSGTFCLVDSCLVLIEQLGVNSVDVKDILLEMRKYRMGLIQTPEQLKFSYQAIIEGAKKLLNPTEDNHIIAENNAAADASLLSDGSAFSSDDEDDDDPPPPPPPRGTSLNPKTNGVAIEDRPLPKIPTSNSCDEIALIDEYIPSGPLPIVPSGEEEEEEQEMSSEDELIDEEEPSEARSDSPLSEKSDSDSQTNNLMSPSELRQRKRVERKDAMEAQVRDMKRRQQINEQWTQLKRPKTSLQD